MPPSRSRSATAGRRRTALTGALSGVLVAGLAVTGLVSPTSAAAATAGPITIGGKCLDDADFGTGNGSVVQVFTCNGSSAQNWTWQADGALTVTVGSTTKCLDVTGASNADGALVQLYDCVAGAPQQGFRHLPDGTLYSARSAKCLAVQGGSIEDHARVGLEPCDPAQSTEQWSAPSAPASGYTLSGAAPVPYDRSDDTPASVFTDQDGSFYYTQAHSLYGPTDSRQWKFYTGADFDNSSDASIDTAVNPANSADRNDDTTWRCNNSPTGTSASYDTADLAGYAERNYCDLSGVWVDPDTGWWYGLVHNEFTPSPFDDGMHYDGIDYAVSKDHGATWAIQGHAITSPYSTQRGDTAAFPQQTYYYGDGDQRMFVDYASGYFYVFYASRTLNKSGGGSIWEEHAARAPISQKMAGSSWQKWYDGAWQSPGVGGAESDIVPADGGGPGYIDAGDDYHPATAGSTAAQVGAGTLPDNSQLAVMNVAWDAYLGKYIATPQNNVAQNTGVDTPLHVYATDSLASEKWVDLGLVTSDTNGAWYRWFLDPANKTSSTVVGRTFRSYCAFECSGDSQGEYVDVTLAPTSASRLPAAPVTGATQITAGNGRFLKQSGTSLTTTSSSRAADQHWTFTATGDGFYTVANAATGQVLGVGTGDAGRAWGAPVTVGTPGSAPAVGMQWSVQKTTSGGFRLVNRYSGLALSMTAGAVTTSPQRGWDNSTAKGGDRTPSAAQLLSFTR
ncbi:RICIN domain-containing protein [Streptomyces sp. NBC_00448]|uniref:RICIN domain-containing protein n=1 Tax=Streptomyces sp. NBC_00448 TaxID=2903652 RepID=UPI002E1E597F